MATTTNQEASVLERAAVYELLARLWQCELTVDQLTELQQDNLRIAYEAAGGFVPRELTGEQLDQLAMDYCQLFIGPSGHLLPYQSVWSEGRFEGATTASLREYVEILEDAGNWSATSPLDHLAIQLEMMGFILTAQAHLTDESARNGNVAIAARFFHDHLAWAVPLCKAAQKRSQTEFYRTLTKLTEVFIEEESNLLSEMSHRDE